MSINLMITLMSTRNCNYWLMFGGRNSRGRIVEYRNAKDYAICTGCRFIF